MSRSVAKEACKYAGKHINLKVDEVTEIIDTKKVKGMKQVEKKLKNDEQKQIEDQGNKKTLHRQCMIRRRKADIGAGVASW